MGKRRDRTANYTITQFISSQFAKQAVFTGLVLLLVSVIVFSASIKFSTDRYARGICSDVSQSARILVETSRLDTYQPFHQEIATKLKNQHGLASIEVVDQLPPDGWQHYSLGHCTIEWQPDFTVAFFAPTNWADKAVYVRGVISPKFIRSDLIIFIFAVCLVLFASYFFGTRSLLRNINDRISGPLHEVWEGLRSGKKPAHLDLKELQDLWNSLVEYKELLMVRNRMLLAKAYYHEIKSPAFYQYNQLKLMTLVDDPLEQKRLISGTLKQADELILQMEKALKKIATDDYARHPKPIDLVFFIKQRDAKFQIMPPVFITGDKTLIKTLLQNLYNNAIEACGNMKLVKTSLTMEAGEVVLSITNPVENGIDIDTTMIFTSGFTSKIDGTGLGLSLCRHIVDLHAGKIEAIFSPERRTFKIVVRFPKIEEQKDAPTEQNALSC